MSDGIKATKRVHGRLQARAPIAVTGLIAFCAGSAAPAVAQPRLPRTPIVVPERRKAPRPPGGLPPSCTTLLHDAARAHWESQATQLAREDTVGGRIARVVDTRATLIARRDLARVPLQAYADTGQAVGQIGLANEHNGLPAGSYCLVLRYNPKAPGTTDEFDAGRWQSYLYDYREPDSAAVAWVPFIGRVSRRASGKLHPAGVPRPYPPARFDLTTTADLSRVAPAREYRVAPSLRAVYAPDQLLAMAVWSMCIDGCCSSGVEALQPY